MKKEDYPDIHPDFLRALVGLPPTAQQEQIRNYRHERDRQRAEKGLPPLSAKPAIPIQLPLWPELARGTPNSFLRSALFPAIQGKTRRYLKKELIAAQKGVSLKFTGQQLDQSDLDVWQQAVEIAHFHKLGHLCQFRANAFLKSIGRSNGKANYQWLDDAINRLVACAVEIRVDSKVFTGSLISSCIRDEKTGVYQLRLDPDTLKLFSGNDWTGIEWAQRQALKGKPLALWLHGFYSSHAQPYPLKVETLKELSGSRTKTTRNFKIALNKAFSELETVAGFKADFSGDLVRVEKPASPAQARHILKQSKSPKTTP